MSDEPKSRYLRIVCSGCNKEQVIFGKTTSKINCIACGKVLAKSSGGKTIVLTKVKEVL